MGGARQPRDVFEVSALIRRRLFLDAGLRGCSAAGWFRTSPDLELETARELTHHPVYELRNRHLRNISMTLFGSPYTPAPWPRSLPREPAQLDFDNNLSRLESVARGQIWQGRRGDFYQSPPAVFFALWNGPNTLPCGAHLIMSDERLLEWWERGIRVRLGGYLQLAKEARRETGGH